MQSVPTPLAENSKNWIISFSLFPTSFKYHNWNLTKPGTLLRLRHNKWWPQMFLRQSPEGMYSTQSPTVQISELIIFVTCDRHYEPELIKLGMTVNRVTAQRKCIFLIIFARDFWCWKTGSAWGTKLNLPRRWIILYS